MVHEWASKITFWLKNITTYEILTSPSAPHVGWIIAGITWAQHWCLGTVSWQRAARSVCQSPRVSCCTLLAPCYSKPCSLLTATFRGDLTNPSAFSWGATIFLNGCANCLQCCDPLCKRPQCRQNETPLSSVCLPFQGPSMENSYYLTLESDM